MIKQLARNKALSNVFLLRITCGRVMVLQFWLRFGSDATLIQVSMAPLKGPWQVVWFWGKNFFLCTIAGRKLEFFIIWLRFSFIFEFEAEISFPKCHKSGGFHATLYPPVSVASLARKKMSAVAGEEKWCRVFVNQSFGRATRSSPRARARRSQASQDHS